MSSWVMPGEGCRTDIASLELSGEKGGGSERS